MTTPLQTNLYPEERRLATVLFADVQGFTSLAEHLDFETVSDLIKEVWLQLDKIIVTHGGYVDKHIGDAVMAVWGAPFAGEGDAERAVSAGLALQACLREYTRTSDRLGAQELKLRVGIHTGFVLAGYVGVRNEYTVMGDTVNVANRLEHLAEPETVVISEATFRLVRGAFQVRRLETLILKGRIEPISTYLVEGVLTQPSRLRYHGLESLETIMIGRDGELKWLEGIYHEALQKDHPTLVMVTGDVGIGKSRFLFEFTNKLELDVPSLNLISTRALSQASRVPFFLWKTLWHNWFGVSEEDNPETTREKYLKEIQKHWGIQLGPVSSVEAAHFIGSLSGVSWPGSRFLLGFQDDPAGRVTRSFELTRELLRRFTALRPTVLMFDDLQWADTDSLELLAYLLEPPGSSPLPLLILVGARPELLTRQLRWANLAEILNLKRLEFNAEAVAAAYPDLRSVPKAILEELAHRAEGNPYYLEEMVKGLVKMGLPGPDVHIEQMVAKMRSQLPESLRVTLQARLDSLSREARDVALLASVIGRVFWVGALMAEAQISTSSGTGPLELLPPAAVERVIQDALRKLARAELAFPRVNSRFSEDQEYIFKNSLLREVAYSLIPHKNRKRYHLAVAYWLAERANPDFKVMAADQFVLGGAIVEAAIQYERAAEYARTRGAIKEAEVLLQRANILREEHALPVPSSQTSHLE